MANGFLVAAAGTSLQYFTDQGVILAGGKVATYVGGTVSTPVTTYTTSALSVANANPIVLGSNGRLPASIWVPSGVLVKMVLQDSVGNPIANGTIDNLAGINDVAALSGGGTTNFLRADGQWVPPIATAPTFTGPVTITAPGGGAALIVNGVAGSDIFQLFGASKVFSTSYAGDTDARGVGRCKYKPGITNVNSGTTGTTLTTDPDLQLTLTSGSIYKIDVQLILQNRTTTGQGFQFQFAYSGTFNQGSVFNGLSGGSYVGVINGATVTGSAGMWTFSAVTFANMALSGDVLNMTGNFFTTSAGTFSLLWAQNSASANNTGVAGGSYMIATKLN